MSRTKWIESCWESYRKIVVPKDAGETQVAITRRAFYSGAAMLFKTIMLGLDPDEEPTETDMQRMADLQAEIDEFGKALDLELLPVGGHG